MYSIFEKINSPDNCLGRNDSIDRLNLPTRLYNTLMNYGVDTVGKLCDSSQKVLYNMRNLGHKSVNYLMEIKKHLETKSKLPQINNGEPSTPAVVEPTLLIESNIPCYVLNGVVLDGSESITLLELPTRIENALILGGINTIKMLYESYPDELIDLRNLGNKSIEVINGVKNTITRTSQRKIIENEAVQEKIVQKQEAQIPNEMLIDLLINHCENQRTIEILKKRYGLITGDRETLEEIGNSLNVTRERIRQIQQKAIKKLMHPMIKEKRQIIELIERLLWENDGIISEEEADQLMPNIFKNIPYDGSSLLDLLTDIGWIQTYKVGEASFYSPKSSGLNLSVLMTEIVQLLKNNGNLMNVESIVKNLSCKTVEIPIQDMSQNAGFTTYEQKDVMASNKLIQLVSRCCRLDPRIEERISNHFTLYSLHNRRHIWAALISQILEKEGAPLHFTEISDKVNNVLILQGEHLDHRKVYSILIGNNLFAHTGVRGMYGLTKWGLKKESTLELATGCIRLAGAPIHWSQIYHYISKYKDTKKQNIRNILYSNARFIDKGNGLYWINN